MKEFRGSAGRKSDGRKGALRVLLVGENDARRAEIKAALDNLGDPLLEIVAVHQRTTIKILFPLVLFVLPAMLLVIVGPALIQILRTLSNG